MLHKLFNLVERFILRREMEVLTSHWFHRDGLMDIVTNALHDLSERRRVNLGLRRYKGGMTYRCRKDMVGDMVTVHMCIKDFGYRILERCPGFTVKRYLTQRTLRRYEEWLGCKCIVVSRAWVTGRVQVGIGLPQCMEFCRHQLLIQHSLMSPHKGRGW